MSKLTLDQQLELVRAEWKNKLPKREVKITQTKLHITINEESLSDYYKRVKPLLKLNNSKD